MDTDTMAKKNRFREVLTQFRAGKIDVLVGTQMIGKGLDFPIVFAPEIVVGVCERSVRLRSGRVQLQRLQQVGYRFPARALPRA